MVRMAERLFTGVWIQVDIFWTGLRYPTGHA